jgi:hypothetical protein
MSSQKKLIEDILSSYDTILGRKNFIKESATFVKLNSTGYSNVKYDTDGTQNDSVNKALLDDIQTAAKSVGVVATITTARTGHNRNVKGSKNVSRHMNGTGVDVAILNGIGSGGASNPTNGNADFRALGDKLKDALVSMGYTLNAEGPTNPKAVLWQTNTGGNHFNHLHISNNSGVSSGQPTTTTQTTTDTADTTSTTTNNTTSKPDSSGGAKSFAKLIGKEVLNVIGVNESFKPNNFGDNVQLKKGKILIPKNSNSKIKSPVSGKLVNILSNSSCINQIVIEFNDGYLEYCGITSPSAKLYDRVGVGTVLGKTNSNVTVTLYNEKEKKEPINLDNEDDNKSKSSGKSYGTLLSKKTKKTTPPKERETNLPDGTYAKLLVKGYQNLKNPKKVDENIERIKSLLK